jgi:hypothetical protein
MSQEKKSFFTICSSMLTSLFVIQFGFYFLPYPYNIDKLLAVVQETTQPASLPVDLACEAAGIRGRDEGRISLRWRRAAKRRPLRVTHGIKWPPRPSYGFLCIE